MNLKAIKYKTLSFLRAFFPLQLLFAHVKYNLFSLFFWFILFSIASDSLGSSFGIPFLFYSPEYRGETNWISFLMIGFSIGGFTMAFHTYSYRKMIKKFPFLLVVSHSFLKFCLNNSLIPMVFLVFFIFKFTYFQKVEEFTSTKTNLIYVSAFLVGFFLFILISFLYFFPKNRKIFNKISVDSNFMEEKINSFLTSSILWTDYFTYRKDRTYIYMTSFTNWKLSRKTEHYDKERMNQVLKKTKISSALFEFTTIFTFFLVGIFRENPILDLPAGMSIIMLLAIIKMLYSTLYALLNYWTFPILMLIFISMNFYSKKGNLFQYKNYAYGLDYSKKSIKNYDYLTIDSMNYDLDNEKSSKSEFLNLLGNWKAKVKKRKPKLIIILTSGGGSRSALWTFTVLNNVDKELNNKLSKHTQMITGASGGMIGAAYYRSLYLKTLLGYIDSMSNNNFKANISKDLLNRLSFSAYSNDILFRLQKLKWNDFSYTKDRAYSFEEHLNENTDFVLNKNLSYFQSYEKQGIIPTMIFTPTIINDGRRLLISSQNLNFLSSRIESNAKVNTMNENVDFQTFFEGNTNIRFLSVLRMSATFPLVLPMVSMPTKPEINIMDAGIRDNYGVKLTYEYLYKLKDWIKKNTSGVILLKIRDTKKILDGENINNVSLFEKFTLPFGNMYRNFTRTQDFDQDELMKIASFSFNFPIDLIEFNLRETSKDRISLSWHLTSQEKIKIEKAFYSSGNQFSLNQLKILLE